ncbi:MAG: patatin-like phospholipase family protein [Actinomycetota bacterium]
MFDWRVDTEPYIEDGYAELEVTVGDQSRRYPIYGLRGELGLELLVDEELLEIVSGPGDEPPEPSRPFVFEPGVVSVKQWSVVALAPGTARFVITSNRAAVANPAMPLDDAQLADMDPRDLNLFLELDVVASERAEWRVFALWMWLPFALLAFVPVVVLHHGARKNPRESPWPAPRSAAEPEDGDHEPEEEEDEAVDLGLVLSGGGMRAAAFSLGAIIYMVEHEQYRNVTHIGSVSGGSLTNAGVAGRTAQGGGREPSLDDLRALARRIASGGLPLERAAKLMGLLVVCAAVSLPIGFFWAAPSPWGDGLPWAVTSVLAVLLYSWLLLTRFGVRPSIRTWIPRFTGLPPDLTLGDLQQALSPPPVDHLFTATVVGTSEHMHLSKYGTVIQDRPNLPSGRPDRVKVATAVQASAAFPGLPHVDLTAEEVGLRSEVGALTLRDGGTLDNLGHIRQRVTSSAAGIERQGVRMGWDHVRTWIVVDASAPRKPDDSRRTQRPMWLLRLLHLGFVVDVAEMAGHGAAEETRETAAAVQAFFAEDGVGIYLSLEQNPVRVCETALGPQSRDGLSRNSAGDSSADDESRIKTATLLLRRLEETQLGSAYNDWNTRVDRNSETVTTLSSLPRERVASLIQHGYVLAGTLGALDLGWEPPTAEQMRFERFVEYVR